MLGKGSLIIIFGLTVAFSTYQLRLSQAVEATVDNFNRHYMETVAHMSSQSAMNMALNEVWLNNTSSDTFMVKVNNCTTVCQITPMGGDTIKVKIRSTSNLYDNEFYRYYGVTRTLKDSIVAIFTRNRPVSEYFWFTNDDKGIKYITNDTLVGPLHCNKVIKTSGSPVFFDKVTAKMGINPSPDHWTSLANFYGGWEIGIDASMPTDLSMLLNTATADNGPAPINTMCLYNQPVTFEFLFDGRVARTVGAAPTDTVVLSTIAPSGVIAAQDDIRVKGIVNGNISLYSQSNIWIDDDIVYADDPNLNPGSDDFLALLTDQHVFITDNTANNSDVIIQATIVTPSGRFRAQNHDTRPVSGTIYLTGSVIQDERGPVGTYWPGHFLPVLVSGYYKNYKYDTRLATKAPPYMPTIDNWRLVAWWE